MLAAFPMRIFLISFSGLDTSFLSKRATLAKAGNVAKVEYLEFVELQRDCGWNLWQVL